MTDLPQLIKNRFPYLPEEKLAELLSRCDIVMLDVGHIFIRAGERTTRIGFVIEGLMRNYTINHNGEEVTVLFAAEMQVITPYATVLLGTPATETSAAVERSMLLTLDLQELRKEAQSDPLLMRLYTEMIEVALLGAILRIEDFTQKRPEQRYQRLLDTKSHLTDRVPLKYLASYLGITAVSLSRIRKRLSQNRN